MITKKLSKVALTIMTTATIFLGSLVPATTVCAAPAATATVTGTVQTGSNAGTMNLSTSAGTMIIKIDSDTNTSGCKNMLPGASVKVGVYRGNDAYMHASTIESTTQINATTTSSTTATVNGTIMDKAMDGNIMYVNTSSGEMHIKLDDTTDYSGAGILYAGKNITMQVARGSDAYMHAVKITDGTQTFTSATTTNTTTNTSTTTSSVPTTASNGAKISAVTGTVDSKTQPNTGILYLNDGKDQYILKLDNETNYSNGYMLLAGQKVTAYIYRGNDAYMHAYSFVRTAALASTSSGSTKLTFTGTVSSKSSTSELYLDTNSGTIIFKLDSNTTYNGAGPVLAGRTLTVDGVSCSDAYWHASKITLVK